MTPNGQILEVSYCLSRHKQLSKLSKLILSYADYYLNARNRVLKQKQRHYSTQSPQKSVRLENELKTSSPCDSAGHSLPGRKQPTVCLLKQLLQNTKEQQQQNPPKLHSAANTFFFFLRNSEKTEDKGDCNPSTSCTRLSRFFFPAFQ